MVQPAPARPKKSIVSPSVIDLLALAFLAVISSLAYVYFRDLNLDDSYITYRIARNAANGLGLVYNEGERVLVSTTPLFTLIMAAIATFYSDVAAAGALVSGAGLFGSSAFLYLLSRKPLGAMGGLIAATIAACFPITLLTLGMETTIYLTFATGALYAYFKDRLSLAAAFLSLALLTRADGILLAMVMLLHHVYFRRQLPYRPAVVYVLLSAPWFVFSQLYYGSPFPATLQAKMAHGQSNWWPEHFLEGARNLAGQYVQENPLFLLFGAIAVLGIFLALRCDHRWGVLFAWTALYGAGYTALGVPAYHWYYAPLVPAIAVAVAAGIVHFPWAKLLQLGSQPSLRLKRISMAIPALFFTLLLATLTPADFRLFKSLPGPTYEIYREAGLWLDKHTPPGSSAAMVEIGIAGFYADRRIIDIVGLTHMDVARQMATVDVTYAIRHYAPDYVVLGGKVMPDTQREPWFGERYVPVKYFLNPRYGPQPLIVFGRTNGELAGESKTSEAGFDGKIDLPGYSIAAKTVRPGENLRVNLSLRRLQASHKDIGAFVALVDRNGRGVAQADTALKPQSWTGGTANQHFDLYVPPTASPGKYQLQSGLYYLPQIEGLPISGQIDKAGNDRMLLGSVKIAGHAEPINPSHLISATVGNKISLFGFDTAVDTAGDTRQLDVRLFWRAISTMRDDYTVFVHLLNEQGKLAGQHDAQPRADFYPTSIWDSGEIVPDSHAIRLSGDLPPGEYQIAVGMYDGSTGKRLQAEAVTGAVSDDSIIIGKIRLP